jgi:hypothetical protein
MFVSLPVLPAEHDIKVVRAISLADRIQWNSIEAIERALPTDE